MPQRSTNCLSSWGRSVSVFIAATLLAVMPAATYTCFSKQPEIEP
jgi:hypothetical protein